jgi:uncharacterized protein YciI
MKYFILELTYTIPADQLGETVAEHRKFLQTGYDRGMFLLSGPQIPRTGGILIARAERLEDLHSFFQDDPYNKKGLATYRWVEFNPVLRQPLLEDWLTGK